MSNDKWDRDVIERMKELNYIASRDYIDSHTREEIRSAYNSALFDFQIAVCRYRKHAGDLCVIDGSVIAEYMEYGTLDDIYPVNVIFGAKN